MAPFSPLVLTRQVFFHVIQHVVRVLLEVCRGIDLFDHALFVDDERGALGVMPVLRQDAIGASGFAGGIGIEREIQVLFVGELLLFGELIGADANDLRVEASKLLVQVAKPAGLDRSTTGQGFGKEIEHDVFLVPVVTQPQLVRGVLTGHDRLQVDVRSFLPGLGHAMIVRGRRAGEQT